MATVVLRCMVFCVSLSVRLCVLSSIARACSQIEGIQKNMLKSEAAAPLVEHDGVQAALEDAQKVGEGIEAPLAAAP